MGTDRERLVSRLHMYKDKKKEAPFKPEADRGTAGAGLPGEWEKGGEFTYIREFIAPHPLPDPLYCPILHPEPLPQHQIVFYDTETTGLSGGAGTRVFLTGFGTPVKEGIKVTQFFLADFPGEYEYLNLIAAQFRDEARFVSFNGKGYDSHLLRSRFGMNGIQFQFPGQIDLLHPARRLWKSIIGSCSLGNIESEILGIHREQDIPGYLIPEVYFDYLRTGSTNQLLDVFHHNLQDVVSLAILLETFVRLYEQPEYCASDMGELGSLLCGIGETGKGFALLRKAYQTGSGKAGRTLGFSHKKEGNREKAAEIWKSLWQREGDLIAGIELAKHLEHKVRDAVQAAVLVEEISVYLKSKKFDEVPKWIPGDIEKRKQRLLRKRNFIARGQKK